MNNNLKNNIYLFWIFLFVLLNCSFSILSSVCNDFNNGNLLFNSFIPLGPILLSYNINILDIINVDRFEILL